MAGTCAVQLEIRMPVLIDRIDNETAEEEWRVAWTGCT